MSRNKGLLSFIGGVINTIAILLLLISYLAPYINPIDFWPIAFMGLTYKLWLLLNIILLVFWLIRKNRRWIYNTVVILIGIVFLLRNFQLNLPGSGTKDFSIVGFNTNVQHVYAGGNTSQDIEDYLKEKDVDIAVMIEWLNKKGRIDNELYPYQQFVILKARRNGDEYGINLVSKHKIINYERITYGHFSNNMTVYYDIDVDGEVIRVVGCHLQSNGISSNDYSKFKNLDFNEENQKRAKTLFNRMKSSFNKRAIQTERIREVIDASPYPVIVVGDFNDTPQSYAYTKMRGDMKDAFVERGFGWGATYLKPFPVLKIDYLFYDKELTCNKYIASDQIKSDHKLLYSEFSF